MNRFLSLCLFILFSAHATYALPQNGSHPRFPTIDSLYHAMETLETKYSALEKRLQKVNGRFPSLGSICEGRLSTESGVGVSTTNRTSQSTLYFVPYLGSMIALYDGVSGWELFNFTQRTLTLAALTSGKNYDVFLYNNAGTLTLELSAAWTNDTTRADALTTQDGIYVKSGATSRRYMGTIRTTSTTTTEDSTSKRFVWNQCNPFVRTLLVIDTTDSWTYTGDTWRAANNSAGNLVEYVTGMANILVTARALVLAKSSSGVVDYISSGVGVDASASNSADIRGTSVDSGAISQVWGYYEGYPGLGYHYLQWIERAHSATSVTFYGDNGNGSRYQSGMIANIRG